jgi:hypothetical protein
MSELLEVSGAIAGVIIFIISSLGLSMAAAMAVTAPLRPNLQAHLELGGGLLLIASLALIGAGLHIRF